MTVKLMLVAGEASGDLLGGELLAGLRRKLPGGFTAFGVGGVRMQGAGLVSLCPMNELSVVGVAEVVRHLPGLVRNFARLVAALRRERPALLITIDLPDFNFMLARRARKLGIPVIHYVSPQVWAWRRGRVGRLAGLLDRLLVLFPFEPEIYAGSGLKVSFVGHPLVELARPAVPRDQVRAELGVGAEQPLVALLPGSRHGELQRMLPVLVATAARVLTTHPTARFVVPVAPTLTPEAVRAAWPAGVELPCTLISGRTYDLVGAADVAVVTSGTATLEVALLGTPLVVVYRVNRITYELGRRLIQVPFIALPNLVAGEEVAPERIQGAANPGQLARDVARLLDDPESRERMRAGLGRIRRLLATPERDAASVVAEFLTGGNPAAME